MTYYHITPKQAMLDLILASGPQDMGNLAREVLIQCQGVETIKDARAIVRHALRDPDFTYDLDEGAYSHRMAS